MSTRHAEVEAQVLAALDVGDRATAATRVITGLGPGILGYLGALLRDDDLARDAFSAFGEALWRALPRFARASSVTSWAYAIAFRCALRAKRSRARRRTRPLRDSEYHQLVATIASARRSFDHTAAARRLDELRASLAPEDQTLLVLRLDRGMTWDEVAVVLGVRGPTAATVVRKRFSRLKARLRRAATAAGLVGAPRAPR
ncbi:MAG: sigma-70 family RNA polymerase sigma factor [Myxococcales bacterium]|nr:sigma-70 family RNA polymerase sigma factor [Myxococcales bacterium]